MTDQRQFNTIHDYLAILDWMKACGDTHALADEVRFSTPLMLIQTRTGTAAAAPGDWIVREEDNTFSVRPSAQARIRDLDKSLNGALTQLGVALNDNKRLERENARLTDALKAIHAHTEPHDRPGLAAGLHLATVRDVRAMANSHKETKG